MTAPGQEPDEVLTATPGGKGAAAEPDLNAIGDNHMPQDLRDAEREDAADEREGTLTRDHADDGRPVDQADVRTQDLEVADTEGTDVEGDDAEGSDENDDDDPGLTRR